MAAAVVVLLMLSFLPARWSGWVGKLGDLMRLVVAPVEAPVYQLVNWMKPAESGKPEAVTALEREIERWKQLYHNQLLVADELRARLEQFGKGAMYPDLPMEQILRPVIGSSAEPGGQIHVRGGTRDGVHINAVATSNGVQLVGKVTAVGSRLSWVRLITDRSAGTIDGVIMTDDLTQGPRVRQLHPVTGRKLQTRVRVESGETPPAIGQSVRLEDPNWPRTAQGLIVGIIEEVQVDSFGWHIVTVRPTVDLERLSEVILRITRETEPGSPSGRSTDGGAP